jgi:hypothetical protein
MELTVSLRQRYLHLSVRDDCRAAPRLGGGSTNGEGFSLGTDGRGLKIVEALAAGWGSTPTENGKVVWATLQLPGSNRR